MFFCILQLVLRGHAGSFLLFDFVAWLSVQSWRRLNVFLLRWNIHSSHFIYIIHAAQASSTFVFGIDICQIKLIFWG